MIALAERRMFAKTIIDSDAFLDMPPTTQLLYFHLSMRADDDGFINKPKSVMRMVGATQGDAEMLIQKKFIIPFESGVVVIKHWKIHNYIRNDRYTETKYKEEMNTLMLDENKAYTQTLPESDTRWIQGGYKVDTSGIPNDDQMDTQDRIGKDRIELGKESIDYNGIKDAYNTLCPSLPAIKTLSDARRKAIKARLNTYTVEDLQEAFRLAEDSDFLKGKNNRNWTANFDWIMKDANLAKILDGNYGNRAAAYKPAIDESKTDLDAYF